MSKTRNKTLKKKMERRSNMIRTIFETDEIRIDNKGKEGIGTLKGYAAVFEKLSIKMYYFREKIRAGAFTKSIKKNNVRALWNHELGQILGSKKSGSLKLIEDQKGLYFEIELPDTSTGRDAKVLVERKEVDGMSFGFNTKGQIWDETDPKNIIRTLTEIDLHEISLTAFPAYPQTSVKTKRSIEDEYNEYKNEQQRAKDLVSRENELKIKLKLLSL